MVEPPHPFFIDACDMNHQLHHIHIIARKIIFFMHLTHDDQQR